MGTTSVTFTRIGAADLALSSPNLEVLSFGLSSESSSASVASLVSSYTKWVNAVLEKSKERKVRMSSTKKTATSESEIIVQIFKHESITFVVHKSYFNT